MQFQPSETIIAELRSNDWLEAGHAIRKVLLHGEDAVAPALPALFDLTLHNKPPIVSYSCAIIKRLGKHAVPFLRVQAMHPSPEYRAMAISLLSETGFRWSGSTRLSEQLLTDRRIDLPEPNFFRPPISTLGDTENRGLLGAGPEMQ